MADKRATLDRRLLALVKLLPARSFPHCRTQGGRPQDAAARGGGGRRRRRRQRGAAEEASEDKDKAISSRRSVSRRQRRSVSTRRAAAAARRRRRQGRRRRRRRLVGGARATAEGTEEPARLRHPAAADEAGTVSTAALRGQPADAVQKGARLLEKEWRRDEQSRDRETAEKAHGKLARLDVLAALRRLRQRLDDASRPPFAWPARRRYQAPRLVGRCRRRRLVTGVLTYGFGRWRRVLGDTALFPPRQAPRRRAISRRWRRAPARRRSSDG